MSIRASMADSHVARSRHPASIMARTVAPVIAILLLSGAPVCSIAQLGDTFALRDEKDFHSRCVANLRQIGKALQLYHDHHGVFPPAYLLDEHAEPAHSWRVLLLPYLGHQELYDIYRFEERWDSEHNQRLLARIPSVYRCPALTEMPEGTTHYVAVIGPRTVWPGHHSMGRRMVTRGTSNTIHVLELAEANVPWIKPRDVLYENLRQGLAADYATPHFASCVRILFVDGEVATIDRDAPASFWRTWLAASGDPFPGVEWPARVNRVREYRTEVVHSRALRGTDIMPYQGAQITPGRNLVYCAGFQILWDKLTSEFIGEGIELEGDPAMARELNQTSFPSGSIAEDAYFAWLGSASQASLDRAHEELRARVPGARAPLFPAPDPQSLFAYVYFTKRLTFAKDFDRLPEPIQFDTPSGAASVKAFGIEHFDLKKERENALRRQVKVLDYLDDDDFVIELLSDTDSILLAKIPPEKTLADAVLRAKQRIASPLGTRLGPLEEGEPLCIPVIALLVHRDYEELQRRIVNPSVSWTIVRAAELINFQLDESGVILDTEHGALLLSEDEPLSSVTRRFIFDKPFLLVLRERDAEAPYLALWIANAEILVLFEEEPRS